MNATNYLIQADAAAKLWEQVDRLITPEGQRKFAWYMWMRRHPFGADLAACAETNS